MIRSSVTVSLVPEAKGGPFVFWDDLQKAARISSELHFDAIEIFAPGPDQIESEGVRTALNENGLELAAIGTGAGWVKHKLHLTMPDATARSSAVAFIKSMIEAGAIHKAPAIIGSMQGRWGEGTDRDTALSYLREALEELGQFAGKLGVPLLFEPLNRYETNLIRNIDEGVQLLTELSTQNVRLLADLFHMNIEEADIAESLKRGGEHIGHIHFVDSNRKPAGNGHIPFVDVASTLKEMNYRGFVSAEALPWPDPHSAAEQTIKSFHRYFRD